MFQERAVGSWLCDLTFSALFAHLKLRRVDFLQLFSAGTAKKRQMIRIRKQEYNFKIIANIQKKSSKNPTESERNQ